MATGVDVAKPLCTNNGERQIQDGKGTFLNGEWKVLHVIGKYKKLDECYT